MTHTKLILVEGIPGSGKTSTATTMKQMLDERGIASQLYLEGDSNHPADYEFVACLDRVTYDEIRSRFLEFRGLMEFFTEEVQGYWLINYGKLWQLGSTHVSQELIDELSKYDIYQCSLEIYEELIVKKWQKFVQQAEKSNDVVVLECCFLQNPLTMMFVRLNQSVDTITRIMKRLFDIIQPLNPKLIYLHQADVRACIDRVIPDRPTEWLTFIIGYYTDQGYGKEQGYGGIDGFSYVLSKRQEYELDIVNQLNMDKLVLDRVGSNWEGVFEEIEQFCCLTQNRI